MFRIKCSSTISRLKISYIIFEEILFVIFEESHYSKNNPRPQGFFSSFLKEGSSYEYCTEIKRIIAPGYLMIWSKFRSEIYLGRPSENIVQDLISCQEVQLET